MKCLTQLTEEQIKICLDDLDYTLERFQAEADSLRQWAIHQRELPQTKIYEPLNFFESFVHVNEGNRETLKNNLKAYYYSRVKYPLLFCKEEALDSTVLETADTILIGTLPKCTPTGSRVTMISTTDKDARKYDLISGIVRLLLVIELRLREEGIFNREWIIFDAQNITFGHVLKVLKPNVVKSFLQYIQSISGSRINGILIINSPKFIERTANIFIRPFLNKELSQKLLVDTEGANVLRKYIPQNILPAEYGGEEESLKTLSDMWLSKGIEKKEWVNQVFIHTIDEEK